MSLAARRFDKTPKNVARGFRKAQRHRPKFYMTTREDAIFSNLERNIIDTMNFAKLYGFDELLAIAITASNAHHAYERLRITLADIKIVTAELAAASRKIHEQQCKIAELHRRVEQVRRRARGC